MRYGDLEVIEGLEAEVERFKGMLAVARSQRDAALRERNEYGTILRRWISPRVFEDKRLYQDTLEVLS